MRNEFSVIVFHSHEKKIELENEHLMSDFDRFHFTRFCLNVKLETELKNWVIKTMRKQVENSESIRIS